MAVVLLCGSILGVALLHAPDPHDQRGVHPPGHESNIELCRWVWQGQPETEKRCLIARRELVQTLERNPYAQPPEEASSAPCHGWMTGSIREGGILLRTIQKRCDKSRVEEAASLSFWFNYLHSAIADAVMWDDQQQASNARGYLTRLEWCDSKYRTDIDPTNYHDVLECANLSDPSDENPKGYRYGPSRLDLEDLDRWYAVRRAASRPRRSALPPASPDTIGGAPRERGRRSLCYL